MPQQILPITVISDVVCPWCYIGKRQLDRTAELLAEQGYGLAVSWLPFQLNPELPPEGAERAVWRAAKFGNATRAAEADARVRAAAAKIGLEFHFDRIARAPNTLAAHRLIRFAGELGPQTPLVEALFHAYFAEGRDVGDAATLTAIATEAGLDAAQVSMLLAGETGEAEVREADAMARRAGIDGVPCFVMRNHVLFSGAVPADAMAEALVKAWQVLSQPGR